MCCLLLGGCLVLGLLTIGALRYSTYGKESVRIRPIRRLDGGSSVLLHLHHPEPIHADNESNKFPVRFILAYKTENCILF
jgi:hypothetical protein